MQGVLENFASISFVSRYILTSSLLYLLTHLFFHSMLFPFYVFVLSLFPFCNQFLASYCCGQKKNAWYNFYPPEFVETCFFGLVCDLSRRTFHVHLGKKQCILLFLIKMSCRYLLSLTGLLCHLRLLPYSLYV